MLPESLSDDSSGPASATVVEAVFMKAIAKTTAVVVYYRFEVVPYRKDNGLVVLYERKIVASLGTLYSYKSPVHLSGLNRETPFLALMPLTGSSYTESRSQPVKVSLAI